MSNAPTYHIDAAALYADPYPDLARMQAEVPVCYVPELGATLLTRRDDIHVQEKRTHIFSSHQPDGLMTVLMGENMMRKDGAAHMAERRALFLALSPRTVARQWKPVFETYARALLARVAPKGSCDLVTEIAMPISAAALKAITGLEDMTEAEMDGVSQAMIDGCANYTGDARVEARCHDATALIDRHIEARCDTAAPQSALAVMRAAGILKPSVHANIKLIISGGQNEPRDAIAGTVAALLAHPDQLDMIRTGRASWVQAFAEYARWMSPIGMSPRRVAQAETACGVDFAPEDRVFLMFGAANRDPAHFDAPDRFDITRDTQAAISFGAGPHFCAGAAASRCLIAEVALPLIFDLLPGLHLSGEVTYAGWAFRGPVAVPVAWDI